MEWVSSLKRAGCWLLLPLGAVACQTKPEPPAARAVKPVPPALATNRTGKPAPPVKMPDAIPQAESMGAEPARETATVKFSGNAGERLEGDVYYFRVRSLRTCDPSSRVAGVEVEIEAKSKLSVNPRDVVIGKGGITFTASLDFKRQLPGCSPLLEISTLQKGQTARGYVLYDLPARPGNDLQLIYQPTRFGGAGYVTAPLKDWAEAP